MRAQHLRRHSFAWIALLLFSAPAALAQADSWQRTPREPAFEAGPERFHYTAAHDLADGRDWVEADFDLRSARLHFGFVSTEPGAASILGLDVELRAVHEFVDADGDPGFSVADEKIQTIHLATLPEPDLVAEARPNSGYEAIATYPLPAVPEDSGFPLAAQEAEPGQIIVTFRFSPEAPDAGNQPLPTQLFYKVTLVGFPHRSNDSRLAVEMAMTPTGEASPDPREIVVHAAPFAMSHAWNEGLLDEGPRPLAAVTLVESSANDANAQRARSFVAFAAIPRGEEPMFASSMGVARSDPIVVAPSAGQVLGHGWLFVVGLAVSGLVVAGATFARLRRT